MTRVVCFDHMVVDNNALINCNTPMLLKQWKRQEFGAEMDATEQPLKRPKQQQKPYYSGKNPGQNKAWVILYKGDKFKPKIWFSP